MVQHSKDQFLLATVMGPTGVLNAAITIRHMRTIGLLGHSAKTALLVGGLEMVRNRRVYERITRHISLATGDFDEIRVWSRRRWPHGRLSTYVREVQAMFPQTPDWLLAVRAWQPINEAVLHAFPSSTRMCIGDGFGVAIEDPEWFGAKPLHEDGFLSFSHASLLLHEPNHRSAVPQSPNRQIVTPDLYIAKDLLTEVGQSLPYVAETKRRIELSQQRLVVVATHTLIQPDLGRLEGALPGKKITFPRMGPFNRILRGVAHRLGWSGAVQHTANLYIAILESCLRKGDIVYVKPHPRDSSALVRVLRKHLRRSGVTVLETSNYLDLIPLEILFRPFGVEFLIAPNCHSGELPKSLGYIEAGAMVTAIPPTLRDTYQFPGFGRSYK